MTPVFWFRPRDFGFNTTLREGKHRILRQAAIDTAGHTASSLTLLGVLHT